MERYNEANGLYSRLTFICSKSIIETLEKRVFIVKFEHISHFFLVDLEEVNISWAVSLCTPSLVAFWTYAVVEWSEWK